MSTGLPLFGFATCYLLALLVDWWPPTRQTGSRLAAAALAGIGVLWQGMYLVVEARHAFSQHLAPLSSWHHWCLITAWGIAVAYLVIQSQRPLASVGLFFIPLVLALIVIAGLFSSQASFPVEHAGRVWGIVHGMALLMGTVVVTIGFAAGIMYLIQSKRLKRKQLPGRGVRLPSLEWLQQVNEWSLLISSVFLGGGLVAGIILNAVHHARGDDPLPWTDPVVLTSSVLFCWLLISCLFNWIYRPARVGRKVAYLTVASFVFLAIALAMTLFGPSSHASQTTAFQPTGHVEDTTQAGVEVG